MGDRWICVALFLLAGACTTKGPFDAPVQLGGKSIDAAQLNRGREAYNFYCRTCHGTDGDGRGPAAPQLETPPRDFRLSTYKFAGAAEDALPTDEDLLRIIEHGLEGTAMLRWNMPRTMAIDIVQYIKTFAQPEEGWRDPDNEIGSLEVSDDPWGAAKQKEGIDRGRIVYHGFAACYNCHPAYETPDEINADRKVMGNSAMPGFRPKVWTPEAKASATYSRPLAGDPQCKDDDDDECPDPENQVCRFGRCEAKVMIMPPDFMLNPLRVGTKAVDLYRVIAAGIPGTAMPMWKGGLDEPDIWAMAYYVESLAKVRGTAEVKTLKDTLRTAKVSTSTVPGLGEAPDGSGVTPVEEVEHPEGG